MVARMVLINELTARRVRNARKNANLTIKSLSQSSGIRYSTLKRLERGLAAFKLHDIVRLAEPLGVGHDDLIPKSSELSADPDGGAE